LASGGNNLCTQPEIFARHAEIATCQIDSLNVNGYHCILAGHIIEALEYFKKQIEFGEKHRVSRALSVGYTGMGYALFLQGDAEEAREYFEKAFAYTKDPFYWSNHISFYALFLFLTGDIQKAEGYIEKVIGSYYDARQAVTPSPPFLRQ
jgi:tetratricopeptide (TPR) repeat protein